MTIDDEIAGIKCSEVLAKLSDYVDGELAPPVRQHLEAHVARCHNCERFGGMFGAVVRSIRAQATTLDEPAAFARLRARLDEG